LPDVGTNVSIGIEQRLYQNLALEIVQRQDYVIGGPDNAVWPREYLPVQDARLPDCPDDAIRAGEEKWLKPRKENAPVIGVLNAGKANRGVVARTVDRFQCLASFLLCDEVFPRVLQIGQGLSEKAPEGSQAYNQYYRGDHRLD
jgi:hypothetical protein